MVLCLLIVHKIAVTQPLIIILTQYSLTVSYIFQLMEAWGGPLNRMEKSSINEILRLRKPKVSFTWDRVIYCLWFFIVIISPLLGGFVGIFSHVHNCGIAYRRQCFQVDITLIPSKNAFISILKVRNALTILLVLH